MEKLQKIFSFTTLPQSFGQRTIHQERHLRPDLDTEQQHPERICLCLVERMAVKVSMTFMCFPEINGVRYKQMELYHQLGLSTRLHL